MIFALDTIRSAGPSRLLAWTGGVAPVNGRRSTPASSVALRCRNRRTCHRDDQTVTPVQTEVLARTLPEVS